MSQGIRTSRYGLWAMKAACDGRYVVHQKEDGKTYAQQHRDAAKKLAEVMGWPGHWVGATVPQVNGIVWVRVEETADEHKFTLAHPESGEDPSEPEEGDIITSDDEHWYQHGKHYFTGDETGLVEKMNQDKFWPNVWRVSDHGNYTILRINLQKEKKR